MPRRSLPAGIPIAIRSRPVTARVLREKAGAAEGCRKRGLPGGYKSPADPKTAGLSQAIRPLECQEIKKEFRSGNCRRARLTALVVGSICLLCQRTSVTTRRRVIIEFESAQNSARHFRAADIVLIKMTDALRVYLKTIRLADVMQPPPPAGGGVAAGWHRLPPV